ncbi:eEF1A lysine and N-terminal methyltransferase-like [Watersipora subatra]|uniref:eEF1A lysine and N-terminal methyltransferase-like n=1 Tax=Watersipora subatra TaxID=2589382 RepID=UPI00355C24CB
MSLLPKNLAQFADKDYWEGFFKTRGDKAFDWYGEYPQLSTIVHKYVKAHDKILMVGCGNSKLSEDLYDLSYHNIVNIDISEQVIKQMNQKNAQLRPKMTYTRMDATQMEFGDCSFKSAIDKGTLDALLPDLEHKSLSLSMLDEVWRVINFFGTYMIISLAQDHVLTTLIDAFKDRVCIFRVHKLSESDEETDGFKMPVFAFIITKLKAMSGMTTIWETALQEDKCNRHTSSEELLSAVKECQYYQILRHKLSHGYKLEKGNQPSFEFYTPGLPEIPRYTMWVVDSSTNDSAKFDKKYSVFIVPQGKEAEQPFASKEGRTDLADSSGYQRLLVVSLDRGHVYHGLDEIKAELSLQVMQFAPAGTKEKTVLFLSLPEGIGVRDIVFQTQNSLSGDIYVEDVSGEDNSLVRHTFIGSSNEPVGSARVITKKGKNKKKRSVKLIVKAELVSSMERIIAAVACHCALLGPCLPSLLIVGLKCGTLATFIAEYIRGIAFQGVSCVEADSSMVSVAQQCYSLSQNLSLISGSSYNELLKGLEEKSYGCVILNGVSLDLLDQSLRLVKEDGLFLVSTDSVNCATVRSKLKGTFNLCQKLDLPEGSILFGCDRELKPSEQMFTEITAKVKEKLRSRDASSGDFAEVLSILESELNLMKFSTA